MALIIDKNLCPQNHRCPMISFCPMEAITQEGFELPKIDSDLCIECGKCIEVCGKRAVRKEK